MHWDSDDNGITPGNFFKADAANETVTLVNASGGDERFPGFNVLAGATAVIFRFAFLNAANDWWWTVDNLVVNATVGGLAQAL